MLSLAGSGLHVWQLLAEARTVTESAEELGARFGIAADDVAQDIGPFINRLHEQGVLVAETPGP
jgi:hypothetical protein